nr:MAG TPA: hypothetical protein [Caudoviricetes sp.]
MCPKSRSFLFFFCDSSLFSGSVIISNKSESFPKFYIANFSIHISLDRLCLIWVFG